MSLSLAYIYIGHSIAPGPRTLNFQRMGGRQHGIIVVWCIESECTCQNPNAFGGYTTRSKECVSIHLAGRGLPSDCRANEKFESRNRDDVKTSTLGSKSFATYTCKEQLISRYNIFDRANLSVFMMHV